MASSFSSNPFSLSFLALSLAIGYSSAPLAQVALKEVVISGSRNEQDKDDIPATVEVVGQDALEAGQVRDIRDVVRGLPNVSVRRVPARFSLAGNSTGRDGNAGFNIRGLEGNRVLILVDAIRSPRSYVFGSNAFGRDYVDVSLLHRVEIVKGPASALYGSDGLAGLVNFITLKPDEFLTQGKTLAGRASVGYSGDDQGVSASATVAGRASDTVQWLLSANVLKARELNNRGDNDAANIDRTTPNPQRDRAKSVLGKLVLRPSSAQTHTLTLEHSDKRSDYELLSVRAKPPLAATSTLSADSYTTLSRDRLTWDARWQLDAGLADSLQTVLSLQRADSREYVTEDRNTAADRVRDVTYDERTTQLGVQANKLVRINRNWAHKLTYGFDQVTSQVNNLNTGITPPTGESFPLKRFPDTKETSTAIYLQDEIVGEQFSFTPAVRVDRFSINASQAGFSPPSGTPAASLSGSAISPKLGVLWRATPQVSVFGNYASGFRAPNASQVNAFFENLTSFYKTIPNPALKPEKSRNVELGVRTRWAALTLDAAMFTSRYSNLIVDSQQVGGAGGPGNPTVFQSVNVGSARINGFEVKGQYDWGNVAGGKLTTPFAYGQTRGTDSSTGRPINSIDPATLRLGAKYDTALWDVRLDLQHHAAKKAADVDSSGLLAAPATQFLTAAATTLDLSGQWRIRKDLRLNLAVMNLTNKKYWAWSSVRGLPASSTVLDAYSQSGRHINVSLVADF